MDKRKELLKKHPYVISQGGDGKWRTYLPDKEKGRKMVKKCTKEAVEEVIIAYWESATDNPTIGEVFTEWNDRRLALKKISPSSHLRFKQIFNRHYKEFQKKRIKDILPKDVEEFLEEQIAQYELSSKSFSNLKTITKGFLKRAKKRELIKFNVEELFQEMDTSESYFKRVIKSDSEEVFSEEELPKILSYLVENLDLKNLGILLMFLTGIRVGELVSLKHSDFEGNAFKIQRTETKYVDENGKYVYAVKDFPKTEAGVRTVIIPKSYAWITSKLRTHNPFGEYIFVENDRRLTTNCIRRRMERICDKLGMVRKSPHKARKTYGSILLDNGIDNKLITDLMGHTDILCTEGHYHRNRKTIEHKSEILSEIPEFLAR
ncbi:MAG: site-specific integrase [Candidatus Gastranaerophilales bacterium]|nr:site-specific integrase [Candidatus Gastranaerophilales bacterium]